MKMFNWYESSTNTHPIMPIRKKSKDSYICFQILKMQRTFLRIIEVSEKTFQFERFFESYPDISGQTKKDMIGIIFANEKMTE